MTYTRALEVSSGDPSGAITGVVVDSPETALSPRARAAVEKGTSASTKRAYRHDWERFAEWCDVNNRTPLPATTATLTEHVTYLIEDIIPNYDPQKKLTGHEVRGLSPQSIRRAIAAIVAKHKEHGLTPPAREDALSAIRGYEEDLALSKDPRAKPRRAQAVTVEGLRTLSEQTDSTQVAQLRDRALVLLGFVTAARVSELILIDIGDVTFTDRGLAVSMYRRKVRKHADKVVPRADAPEMIDAVKAWVDALAAERRTTGPLFLRINQHGHIGYRTSSKGGIPAGSPDGRISADGARKVIRRAFLRAGVCGNWTGHSMRRGFATEARFAGHDKTTITRGGDWHPNSAAVDGYMDDADQWIYNALKGVGF